MLRLLCVVPAVLSSACTLHHARLESSRDVVVTKRGDGQCGPLGIRRASLGARWGEYVRVSVTAPAGVSGEARLHVDGRAFPLQRFSSEPDLSAPALVAQVGDAVAVELPALLPAVATTHTIALDAAWTNERLDVPAALGPGHLLDVTITGLRTEAGSCADVVVTVEQGVFHPTVDERAWVAELTRRGGPELQAWLQAEAARRDEVRRAHVAEAEQRRVAWVAAQAERRAALQVTLEVEATRERAAAAERVEVARVEAARREEVRQAHYAAWAQRREARGAAVAVATSVVGGGATTSGGVATPAPNPGRGSVGASLEARAAATGVGVPAATTAGQVELSVAASASAEARAAGTRVGRGAVDEADEVDSPATGASRERGEGSVAVEAAGGTWTRTSVATVGGRAELASDVALRAWAQSEGGEPGLRAQAVSRESIAAADAASEWSTPSTFATGTERVTSASAPVACAPPRPAVVATARPEPVVVEVLGALLGALFNAAVRHEARPASAARVHEARPAAAAQPSAPPTPPAPRSPSPQPPPPPPR